MVQLIKGREMTGRKRRNEEIFILGRGKKLVSTN